MQTFSNSFINSYTRKIYIGNRPFKNAGLHCLRTQFSKENAGQEWVNPPYTVGALFDSSNFLFRIVNVSN